MTASDNRPPALTIARAGFVTDRVLVGGDLDSFDPDRGPAQLAELVDAGVTHILDTRREWSDEEYVSRHAPAVGYRHLGVDDDGGTLPDQWFDEATEWLDAVLAEPGARVLVHCHMGVNRSPSLVFGYLLHRGHGVREALDLIRGAWDVAVVDYADDALAWHHRRTHAVEADRRSGRGELERWRRENRIDGEQVIRSIRQHEWLQQAAIELARGSDILRDEDGREVGRSWLYQMSADNVANCVAEYGAGVESWILPVGRYTDDVLPGDLLLLWQMGSGDEAGLFGFAVVTDTGLTSSRPKDRADPHGDEQRSQAVEAEPVLVAPSPLLTRPELTQWPEFDRDRLDLFAMAQRPNVFPVEPEHLDRIADLLKTKAAASRR